METTKPQFPSMGRIVHYRVSASDLERLAEPRFGLNAKLVKDEAGAVDRLEWSGNWIRPGDTFPMVVVRPWCEPAHYRPGESCVNGQVLLDGPGFLWALSVVEAGGARGDGPGTWSWPPKV